MVARPILAYYLVMHAVRCEDRARANDARLPRRGHRRAPAVPALSLGDLSKEPGAWAAIMPWRQCGKCKAVFDARRCPSEHPPFFYAECAAPPADAIKPEADSDAAAGAEASAAPEPEPAPPEPQLAETGGQCFEDRQECEDHARAALARCDPPAAACWDVYLTGGTSRSLLAANRAQRLGSSVKPGFVAFYFNSVDCTATWDASTIRDDHSVRPFSRQWELHGLAECVGLPDFMSGDRQYDTTAAPGLEEDWQIKRAEENNGKGFYWDCAQSALLRLGQHVYEKQNKREPWGEVFPADNFVEAKTWAADHNLPDMRRLIRKQIEASER